ncbi:hypothetical protein FOA24_26495 [Bacillus thuringiensis]|uniref:hypothetical protein n=1 Tax=Bacillus thuringiensis TaxID=1428 RepID=UPI003339D08C
MNERLRVQTFYLVMVGNLFIRNPNPLLVSKDRKSAMEFDYTTAKEIAKDVRGVVVRKTVEYEVVSNR